jgi:hypothetical protein
MAAVDLPIPEDLLPSVALSAKSVHGPAKDPAYSKLGDTSRPAYVSPSGMMGL